jgi:phosphopantothenoylcysteine decarboxylase/phosphopantothenate--cysteine ligase
MDLDMYRHNSTQRNLETLRSWGVEIIEPESGELASGLEGKGRMAEPEDIVLQVESIFAREGSMKGKKVLVTAGPTREPIDPVRYISNHSSGKMAYALAREAALRGADVTVVSGPVNIKMASHRVKVVNVNTAAEMFQATKEHTPDADVVILCAAVADFTVAQVTDKKIKREKSNYNLELTPTNDIAAWVGENRGKDTIAVGFALETNDEEQNAAAKLSKKKLDMIVLNSMRDSGAGFGHDTSKVTLFFKDGDPVALPLKSKGEVAADIVDNIEKLQKDIIEEKQEQQTKKLNKIIGLFGILAVISIICDFLQVADWFSLNLPAFWDKLQAGTLAAGDIVHLALSLLIPLLLVILVVYAVCTFAKSYSKK